MSGLDADRLVQLGRADALAVSPDGTWAAVAVARLDADGAKFVHDLWRVDLADPAVAARQLTRGPSDDRAPAFRRDGALGFLSNRNPRDGKPEDGDDERAQVWILPADGGGEPRPLTDEALGVAAFRFAAAGDALVCVAPVLPGVSPDEQRKTAADRKKHGPSDLHYRQMPVRYWDAWVPAAAPHLVAYTEDGRERRDLTPDADREHREPAFDVSRDGRVAVLSAAREGADRVQDRALRLIALDGSGARTLGESPRTVLHTPRISPDGRWIACVRHERSHERHGALEVWLFDTRERRRSRTHRGLGTMADPLELGPRRPRAARDRGRLRQRASVPHRGRERRDRARDRGRVGRQPRADRADSGQQRDRRPAPPLHASAGAVPLRPARRREARAPRAALGLRRGRRLGAGGRGVVHHRGRQRLAGAELPGEARRRSRPRCPRSSGSTAGRGRSGPMAGTGAGTRWCRSARAGRSRCPTRAARRE